jgi:hypothetical protein
MWTPIRNKAISFKTDEKAVRTPLRKKLNSESYKIDFKGKKLDWSNKENLGPSDANLDLCEVTTNILLPSRPFSSVLRYI